MNANFRERVQTVKILCICVISLLGLGNLLDNPVGCTLATVVVVLSVLVALSYFRNNLKLMTLNLIIAALATVLVISIYSHL